MSWWPSIQRRRIGIRRRSCQIECSQIVLKCLYLTRIESPDIPWTVNKLARAITKRVRACDNRLVRLISCIHFTSEYNQYCHVWNTVQKIRLWLFQDFDTAGNPEDSKSTSGGTLCVFGSRTFVPISWMWKKQTCVSHSSTDSEIISLNTGLRMDGIPVLDPWDLDITVIHSNSNQEQKDKQARRNPLHDKATGSDEQCISSDAHNTHIFLVSTSHDSSHKACAQNSHSWSAFSCHSLVLMNVLSRLSASHLLPLCFPFHSLSYRVEFPPSLESEESLTVRLGLKHRLSVQHWSHSRDGFQNDLRPDGQLPGKSITECFRVDPASKIQKQQS